MKKNLIYLIGIVFLMASCYPGEIESYQELDLVFTNYDQAYNFVSKGTYAMPDKIVKITGDLAEGEMPEFVKEPYNTQILTIIEQNMTALGWTKVDDPKNADLALMPASWTNTTIVYWYDYWCWYYYYYCGWGWYYPYTTSYTTGTLVMTLVSNSADYTEPHTVWTAAINGLMSGAYNTSRVTNAINQAFKQSEYLSTK